MRASGREGDCELCSLSDPTAHRDLAAMQLDQFLHQRQTDSRAFVRAGARAFHAMKAFEDLRQLLFRNAGPGIAHGQDDRLILRLAKRPRSLPPP